MGRDHEAATYTHCEVPQFAPSISSVIGGQGPQTLVWRSAVAVTSAPGFLMARMYYRYYLERLPLGSSTARLVYLNFVLNIPEQISLVGLSFVPSSELFEVHEAFFLTFLATSMLSIL